MEFRRVTAQDGESLERYFEALGNYPDPTDARNAFAAKMVALIRHLEATVEGPAQWVTTSHFWFYMSDKDTYQPEFAQVFVYGREYGFDIKYRSTREFVSWESSYMTLKAYSLAEAGEMVKLALSLAEKDLPALR